MSVKQPVAPHLGRMGNLRHAKPARIHDSSTALKMSDDTPHIEDNTSLSPPPHTVAEAIKIRLASAGIGFTAHLCRLLALAPILGAPMIALMAAGSLTGNEERFTPFLEKVLPEELHTFSGGLMEFGLPIARKYIYLGFWIFLPLTIIEQITGWRVVKHITHPRYWSLILIGIFGLLTLFEILFHNVKAGFFKAAFILCFVNGFLCVSALVGVGALFLINFIEKALIDKLHSPRSRHDG